MTNSSAYSLPGSRIDLELIVRTCCKFYDITQSEIYSKSQKGAIPESRGCAMYFIRKLLRKSNAKTGYVFFADHSTVSYWLKHIIELCQVDRQTKMKFIGIAKEIGVPLQTVNEFLNEKN